MFYLATVSKTPYPAHPIAVVPNGLKSHLQIPVGSDDEKGGLRPLGACSFDCKAGGVFSRKAHRRVSQDGPEPLHWQNKGPEPGKDMP